MKNLTLVLIGCALLWACSQPKPEPEAARRGSKSSASRNW